ncbi:hypothetical protein DNU06_09385 [Putridiphycobacter roseus]|uniref:TonB-dependent receptor-like beta-barrel domain-containing protein n=2 Tax=Putridiphycobacter roseus TaxID=2219161 RepID=A0A2W1NCY1_9FLAO|nr:hypothetical protein DNU06_09385 [Putridiphycobacter roseus]
MQAVFSQNTGGTIGTEIIFVAERNTTPSYRVTENPVIIDTVIPLPSFTYPMLPKSYESQIVLAPITPSRIKIVDKLEKLYPGYVKLGLGNYTMPYGEVYYNAQRNRKFNYGVHANHLSSFGAIKDYAPSQFDQTKAKLFGDFFLKNHTLNTQFDYKNFGYHYYGLQNDSIPKDSLKNRVAAYNANVRFYNTPSRDSAKLLYNGYADYQYFHEFKKDTFPTSSNNARENTINFGSNFKYKYQENIFALDIDFLLNYYKFGEGDTSVALQYRKKTRNNIFSLKPTVTTFQFKDKLKVEAGLDLNFDFNGTKIFKPVPIIKAQFDLLKGILIPYVGIDGDLTQNSFDKLNQANPYIVSSVDILNQKTFSVYGGLKGSISKFISYNVMVHTSKFSDMALFVNDTVFSDMYRFDVVYDNISVIGLKGSITFQQEEKLKVDAYTELNRYSAEFEKYAWHLPDLVIGLRGAYNMFDKIYIKADVSLQGGRKSPGGLFALSPSDDDFKLGFINDINLEGEYRYNKRLSAFIQFNNLASQRYYRWYNYPVFRFQVLGGVTFSF